MGVVEARGVSKIREAEGKRVKECESCERREKLLGGYALSLLHSTDKDEQIASTTVCSAAWNASCIIGQEGYLANSTHRICFVRFCYFLEMFEKPYPHLLLPRLPALLTSHRHPVSPSSTEGLSMLLPRTIVPIRPAL